MRKNNILRYRGCLSLPNRIGALNIISIAKFASKKIGAVFHSIKFLSCTVALYLYKSTIQSSKEYCCHVWAGDPSCNLDLLDNVQNQICTKTVGPSLAASLEPFTHHRNVARLSLFYRCYSRRCSSELAKLVPLPNSQGRSTHCSDRFHDFFVTIPRCYKDDYVTFLSSHSYSMEFFAYRMLFFVLCSKGP